MKNVNFAQKAALITGASLRIGKALALALADNAIRVGIHYFRSEKPALALASTLKQRGVQTTLVSGDLSSPETTQKVLENAASDLNGIDYLINNASVWHPSHLMSFNQENLQSTISVNTFAPLVLTRSFARASMQGVVLNLLDCRMTDYDQSNVAYHLSKRLLSDLTRLLAIELAPRIRVNAVAPGLILPPKGGRRDYLEQRRKSNPLERIGTLKDITDAALFLLNAPSVTGQTVFVDGGRNLNGSVY